MAKQYGLKFGSGDPRINTGLTPTFLIFFSPTTGQTIAPPGISESLAGSGLYTFVYGPTSSVEFLVDGAGSLSSIDRYITGILDPIQAVDEKVGYTTDSYGTTNTDPTTLWGQTKRNQEFNEGNATYNKTTTLWDIYSRGSSQLLAEKTLTNTVTSATKT
jgi:hypothetical protein